MILEGTFGKTCEPAILRIRLYLPVPNLAVVLREPFTQGPEFAWVEGRDLLFYMLDAAHIGSSH